MAPAQTLYWQRFSSRAVTLCSIAPPSIKISSQVQLVHRAQQLAGPGHILYVSLLRITNNSWYSTAMHTRGAQVAIVPEMDLTFLPPKSYTLLDTSADAAVVSDAVWPFI
ncbi:hypothetical protein K438DRAFT_1975743 [Mycena galopus ATCC 62051]|nr:hypothetical protein K438DRAFT_1975743 [Mycena galopus ATCC 62051]